MVDSQAKFFLENVAKKGVFEYVSGDIQLASASEQDVLQFLKLVFASLKEPAKLEVNVSINVES